jgi:hypothetical protein
MPLSSITFCDKSLFFSALHLKWNVLYWEEKKQFVEGGKEGIKTNSTVSHRRGKSY